MELLRPDLLLLAWGISAALMGVLWLVQRRTGDAGVVDVGWSAGLGMAAVAQALASDAPAERRLLVGALAGTWSARLAIHLYTDRVRGREEDGRYRKLRAEWGAAAQRNLLLFFQAQALSIGILSIPYVIALTNPRGSVGVPEIAGAALLVLAVAGETVADRQLARFRADPANRGRTCRSGLWRLSRHPNYFFEWLQWWSWVPLAWGSPLWWVSLSAPALMLWLMLRVSGIPPTEARALETRGDDYRHYQRTTSAFVPWFPREPAR
jgi:steroid 5-alpha reductase family enzyme